MVSVHSFGQQLADEAAKVPLRVRKMVASVHEHREFGALGPVMGDERVRLQHGFQPLAGSAGLVADHGEMLQMPSDVPFVPGGQDRLHVGEVLVQCRAPDAGLLGDLRHRDRGEPVLGHQRGGRIQGGVAHRATVLVDRLGPQLRHAHIIHDARVVTL